MALTEYATETVPDVVKKSVPSFFYSDPLMRAMKQRGTVKRSGGTEVRFVRVMSGHSDLTEINATNMAVALNKKQTLAPLTANWTKYIKPIILPRIDLDRMQSAAMKKAHILRITQAAVQSLRNGVCRRIYIGDSNTTDLAGLGTLNGGRSANPNTTGTSAGLINGAIEFDTKATQDTNGNSYLNQARLDDSTVDDEDNWHNQFVQHGGIGVDCLESIEEVKILADSYAEDDEGISIGIMSVADHVALGAEVRAYPGGANASAIVYTTDDIKKGRAHKTVWAAGGVFYYSNRWMTAARLGNYPGAAGNINEAIYLLNPNYVEWWVNANNDFRVTPFKDFLLTNGNDADVGFINLETQFACPGLMMHGGVRAA